MSLGGGFFGSGAKSNTQTTATTTSTTNVSGGASEGSWNISSSGDVSLADPGLIEFAGRFASETLGLIERTASGAQQNFEKALSQTLNIADAEKTGNSQRLVWLGIAAVVGFVAVAVLNRS